MLTLLEKFNAERVMDAEREIETEAQNSVQPVQFDDSGYQLAFKNQQTGLDFNSPWIKPEFFLEGSGVKLKVIDTVVKSVEIAPDTFIQVLHYLLFLYTDEKSDMRRNVLEFSGLTCLIETASYACRIKLLSILPNEQLEILCHSLSVPVSHSSRQMTIEILLKFLTKPYKPNTKDGVLPVSKEELTHFFNEDSVSEILSKAIRFVSDEIEKVPGVHLLNGNILISSAKFEPSLESNESSDITITQMNASETDEKKNPGLLTSCKILFNPQIEFNQLQGSSKIIELPNVYELCQNYDLNNQKGLFTSVTLALTTSYSNQAITSSDTEFRQACSDYMRNVHANLHQQPPKISILSRETPQQAAVRRAQNAERMRRYRQNQKAQETEEQAAARRAQNALRVREYRNLKQEKPESAALYRTQNALRMRMYRQRLQAIETKEEAAARRARNAERVRLYRKLKQEVHPDVYRSQNAQRMREYRHTKVETANSS